MRFTDVLFVAFLVIPWLNPFATGPSPAVLPWLTTVCAVGFLALLAAAQRHPANDVDRRQAAPSAAVWVATAWLIAGSTSAVMGLLQYFGATGPFAPWVNVTNFGEAFANLRQRNQFATLTNIALAALLWLAVRTPPAHQSAKRIQFGMALAAVCLLAVGNAISSSRTGMVQLLLLCGLYAVWGLGRRTDALRLLSCAGLVYAVAMFAVPWVAGLDLATHGALARFGNDEPCSSRWVLWSNVMHLIAQKPWLGWGWGELDYAHFITLYNEPRFCDILDNAHNLPLQLAVELGIPAALLVCGGFAWWAIRQKPWAERDGARQMAWAVVAVILLHSMLEYPLWYGPFQIALGLCVLILGFRPASTAKDKVGAKIDTTTARSESNMPNAKVNPSLLAITIIAFSGFQAVVAYAAWDYHRISQIYLLPEARHPAYQADTLAQARKSWLYADQALFAELMLTPITSASAAWVYASAERLLHYSPEPRVIQKAIESAVMLGKDAAAIAYLARYKAAFAKDYAAWSESNRAAAKN